MHRQMGQEQGALGLDMRLPTAMQQFLRAKGVPIVKLQLENLSWSLSKSPKIIGSWWHNVWTWGNFRNEQDTAFEQISLPQSSSCCSISLYLTAQLPYINYSSIFGFKPNQIVAATLGASPHIWASSKRCIPSCQDSLIVALTSRLQSSQQTHCQSYQLMLTHLNVSWLPLLPALESRFPCCAGFLELFQAPLRKWVELLQLPHLSVSLPIRPSSKLWMQPLPLEIHLHAHQSCARYYYRPTKSKLARFHLELYNFPGILSTIVPSSCVICGSLGLIVSEDPRVPLKEAKLHSSDYSDWQSPSRQPDIWICSWPIEAIG